MFPKQETRPIPVTTTRRMWFILETISGKEQTDTQIVGCVNGPAVNGNCAIGYRHAQSAADDPFHIQSISYFFGSWQHLARELDLAGTQGPALAFTTDPGKEKTALFTSVFIIGQLFVTASFFKGSDIVLFPLFLVMIFLFGCCIICAAISFKTLLQKSIDNKFSGRVFAVAGSVGNASIPGAMIIYGFLLEKFKFEGLLMVSGLVLMPLSIISCMLYKEKVDGRASESISKSIT